MEEGRGGAAMLTGWGPGGEPGFGPSPAPGAGGPTEGSERLYLGGIWEAGWIREPQRGAGKFKLQLCVLARHFPPLCLPLAVPDVWLWPV